MRIKKILKNELPKVSCEYVRGSLLLQKHQLVSGCVQVQTNIGFEQ